MPEQTFKPQAQIIIVDALIKASHPIVARLALDTGASRLMLSWRLATNIGLPVNPKRTIHITTATAVESVPAVIIPEITILGKTTKNVEAVIKNLPKEAGVDGLLGLSFLKHFKLTIDFPKGKLTLE